MEIASLRYLLAVAEVGSFAKAAAHLGLNASTLTRRVAALEDELGVTLLERSRVGVGLTSGGSTVIVEFVQDCTDSHATRELLRLSVAPVAEPQAVRSGCASGIEQRIKRHPVKRLPKPKSWWGCAPPPPATA